MLIASLGDRASELEGLCRRICYFAARAPQEAHSADRLRLPWKAVRCLDAGVRLMRIDSELILRALRASNDDGFGALPIHDALIAPARNIGQAQANMVEAFAQRRGGDQN
jgi:hypothetical protein